MRMSRFVVVLAFLERLKKYCSHSGNGIEKAVFLVFGFVSAQLQGFLNLRLRRSLAKNQKCSLRIGYSIFLTALAVCRIPICSAQNTVFTYQGRVTDNGTNFNGAGQFEFALVTSTNSSDVATATANLAGQFVVSYSVTFPGNGYVTAPAVMISGGGGAGAAAHAVISGGVVTSVLADNAGSNYVSVPTVTIAPPPASLAYTTYWSNDGTSVNGSEPGAWVGVNVNNGLFAVVLGDTTQSNMEVIPASLFNQQNLQLRIWFNDGVSGFAALNPVQNLTPTPYATFANTASNVLGVVSSTSLPNGLGGSGNVTNGFNYNVVSGGQNNTNNGSDSFIGGGFQNNIFEANNSVIGGGMNNSSMANQSTIAGGWGNSIGVDAQNSSIGGGAFNSISNEVNSATIAGGTANIIQATNFAVTIGGGNDNIIDSFSDGSVIGGGQQNTVVTNSRNSTIDGGIQNSAIGYASAVGGGEGNTNSGNWSTLGGGYHNIISNQLVTVGGGYLNVAGGTASTVAGGEYNVAANTGSTVGGGDQSTASGQFATVAGGQFNSASGFYATVGGGQANTNSGAWSTMSGGWANIATGPQATVSGGYANAVSNQFASVGGGLGNVAGGFAATVPGGYSNNAVGDYSFAAGAQAYAPGTRSFVWNSFPTPNYSTSTNEFYVFAENGFSLDYDKQIGPGTGGDRYVYIGRGHAGPANSISVTIQTWTGAYLSDGGAWTASSDRARKENFANVDTASVLDKVAALPVQTWNYKNEPSAMRHLGPVAQDFHAAFGLNGPDDTHISDVDEAGVALAAIQGLNEKVDVGSKNAEGRMQMLEAENAELKARLERLEKLIESKP